MGWVADVNYDESAPASGHVSMVPRDGYSNGRTPEPWPVPKEDRVQIHGESVDCCAKNGESDEQS
jgi:hypothetical protein